MGLLSLGVVGTWCIRLSVKTFSADNYALPSNYYLTLKGTRMSEHLIAPSILFFTSLNSPSGDNNLSYVLPIKIKVYILCIGTKLREDMGPWRLLPL